jgi:hypothetical protein
VVGCFGRGEPGGGGGLVEEVGERVAEAGECLERVLAVAEGDFG